MIFHLIDFKVDLFVLLILFFLSPNRLFAIDFIIFIIKISIRIARFIIRIVGVVAMFELILIEFIIIFAIMTISVFQFHYFSILIVINIKLVKFIIKLISFEVIIMFLLVIIVF